MTVVEGVGWVLVHFLWQGAAIAILLRLVLALAAPSQSTLRYGLGCGALVLMLLAPLATTARLARAADAPADAARAATLTPTPAMTQAQAQGQAHAPTPGLTSTPQHDPEALEQRPDAAPLEWRPDAARIEWRPDTAPLERRPDAEPVDRGLDPGRLASRPIAGEAGPPAQNVNPLPWGEGRVRGLLLSTLTAMLPWLVAAWAIGVMLLSVRLAGGWWRTRTLRTRGIEAMPDACQRMATRLLARMRIARPVAFFVSSRVTAPIVFGHIKPVVLVPAAVLAGLSPSQLDAILAHELAHVRRHDYLVNLLQTVIETVFFYHPAVWWISRQVRQAREECCDDIAVDACGDRKDYVEALLGLEQMRHATATVALGATGGSLLARARRLLIDTEREREGTSPRLTASAIAITVAAIAMAGISMAATEPVSEPVTIGPSRSSSALPAARVSSPSGASDAESRLAQAGPAGEHAATQTQQDSQPSRKPQPVIAAPDPSAPFAARRAWAEREANTRRASRYWLGYSIRPVKGLHPIVYFDRPVMVMTSDGVKISGHFFSDRGDGLRFPGHPLAITDADPAAIKILFLLETRGGSARLTRIHASTLPLPFEANDRPIFWIGAADTASSLALIDGLYAGASTQDFKKDLVNTAGIHDDSPTVVTWLEQRVRGGDPDEVRAEAVEALAWHPIAASLAALERAARQDRVSRVRQEAAEALGDLAMPEAAPVLIALAKSLDDPEARREAIEALGERPEMAARDALGAIARDDADVEMQREAVETLGDFNDDRGVPVLREILRAHPRADVRREAIETLVDRATPADALALLREVIEREGDIDVRREAVERLADLKDDAGRALLIEVARTHASDDLRAEATESLADLKPSAEIVQALKQIAMSDRTLHVRSEAVETLADLADGQGIDALIEIARDHTDHDTRKKALEALTDSNHPKARKLFESILLKPSGE
jgi:beta-lactamase regulating signal transducer with metallopeptidase domain/HEAT repeat protein